MIWLRYFAVVSVAVVVPACDAVLPLGPGATIEMHVPGGVTIQEELEIYVGNRIIFETGRSDIRPRGRDTLRRVAFWMVDRNDVVLLIEGHSADAGTREDDLMLGASRALAALDQLVALGVDESRLKAISYGQERPAADDYNQRVMLVVFDGWQK